MGFRRHILGLTGVKSSIQWTSGEISWDGGEVKAWDRWVAASCLGYDPGLLCTACDSSEAALIEIEWASIVAL